MESIKHLSVINSYSLSKDDIKAMRNCEGVVFRVDQKTSTAEVTLNKSVRIEGFSEKATVSSTLTLPGYFTIYDETSEYFHTAVFSCSYVNNKGTWQALCQIVKEGDELAVICVAGNDSLSMKENGFHDDLLTITVRRNSKTIIRGMELDHWVSSEKHSYGRAIKISGLKESAA